ncbi:hypothetical protein ACFE04_030058 [Oxalis oulophora]
MCMLNFQGWAVRVGEPILRGTFVCELIGELNGDFTFSKPNLLNYQVLVDNMDSQHAHIGLYAIRDYDFPRQEVVIEFVLDAIQAEAFNPNTLFLIGSYTIGKERLFLEVARVLRRKVYVAASKCHILKCMGISEEDMQCLIVAFSPTGWTFGKGKQKSTGRRWKHGTLIR